MRTRWSWLPVVALLLFAWWAFITHLDLESLWYDEGISWTIASSPTLGDFFAQWPLGTGHPPAYFAWTWAWIQWTGTQDVFVMRLSVVIPMLLALAMVYRVGWAWFRSRWVGVGALVFLATSGLVVYYARELRMYSLIILLVVTGWWLLRRWLDGHTRSLWLYALVVALMAYTHYLSAFFVLAQALVVLQFYPRRFPRLVLGYLVAGLLVLPWIPTFIIQTTEASFRAGRDGTFTLGNIGQFAVNQPTDLDTTGDFIIQYTAGQVGLVGALVVLAFSLGMSRANTPRVRRSLAFAAAWLLTLALVWAVNVVVPVYNPRYVLPLLPALGLLVGVALHQLPGRARLPVLAVIGLTGIASHTNAFLPPKIPHHDLLTTVDSRWMPGDRLWYNLDTGALGSTTEEEIRYYLRWVTPNLNGDNLIWDAPNDFRDPNLTRVWDVRPYWIAMPPEAEAALLDERVMSEQYTFGSYRVRLYEKPPDAPEARFGDLFALRVGAVDTTHRPGDTITLKLWWRALETIPRDYSYSLTLRDEQGQVAAQSDAGLVARDNVPTSQWSPGEDYALAMPALSLPAGLPTGRYSVWIAVYYWEAPQPLTVDVPEGQTGDAGEWLKVTELIME